MPVTGACGQPTDLGCDHIFLIGSARDNPQCIIRQRSLQCLCLIPRRAHPDVAFFLRCKDDRHDLRIGDKFIDEIDTAIRIREQSCWSCPRIRSRASGSRTR